MITAVLWMRFESTEKALKSGRRFSTCPKVQFWANNGPEAYVILHVEDDQRFWTDYVGANPETGFGGVEAQLTYMETPLKPSKMFSPVEKREGEVAPCGSRCLTCPTYKNPCTGCPALILP
ncbi:MAG: hypothetical protein NWE89_16980 [Candidatus Bathyarchaeota archaeon]|nr:hypothetical protein [Candidatus Bathyarchaeota archaeon]